MQEVTCSGVDAGSEVPFVDNDVKTVLPSATPHVGTRAIAGVDAEVP